MVWWHGWWTPFVWFESEGMQPQTKDGQDLCIDCFETTFSERPTVRGTRRCSLMNWPKCRRRSTITSQDWLNQGSSAIQTKEKDGEDTTFVAAPLSMPWPSSNTIHA
jgi:hypothetical protein